MSVQSTNGRFIKGDPRITGWPKGRKHSEESRRKMSLARIGRKLSDKHIANIVKASQVRPSRPEIELGKILNRIFPGEYKYVGNGAVLVARKNPDFINIKGKNKVIELFGEYWHKDEDAQARINIFKSAEYEALIVWESELKDLKSLEQRLKNFHINGQGRNEPRSSFRLIPFRGNKGRRRAQQFIVIDPNACLERLRIITSSSPAFSP